MGSTMVVEVVVCDFPWFSMDDMIDIISCSSCSVAVPVVAAFASALEYYHSCPLFEAIVLKLEPIFCQHCLT